MKILLINPTYKPDFCKSARWAAKSRGRVQRHPDWMCMATAVLEEAGHKCKFIDAQAQNMTEKETRKIIRKFQPHMGVIWATTPSIYNDVKYGGIIKEESGKDCLTVFVGAHPTALPKETILIDSSSVDAIAMYEFDYTLRELANGTKLEKCLGIAYHTNGKVKINSMRPLIENLDELPFPAWHHIDPKWYHDAGKRYPFITMIGGRGCSNICSFCRERFTIEPGPYRKKSPKKLVDEIEYDFNLFPYLQEIMIEDDTFTADAKQIIDFCKELKERDLDITWSCNARADITNINVLKKMKEAGCRMLCVGYEFGNQKLLDAVNKRVTLDVMRKFAKLTKEVGLKVNGCFMIGAPGETRRTARQTIEFAKELNPNTAQFSVMVPYPGTLYYRWIKKNGFIIAKDWTEWVNEDLEQATVISYPQLSKDEMEEFVDKGLREFYLRPSKIIELVIDVRSLSDIQRKLHGISAFFDYFSKH